jgi:hypothetical protein
MANKNTTSTVPNSDRNEADRKALIERARGEIPALRKTVQDNLAELRRIAGTDAATR